MRIVWLQDHRHRETKAHSDVVEKKDCTSFSSSSARGGRVSISRRDPGAGRHFCLLGRIVAASAASGNQFNDFSLSTYG